MGISVLFAPPPRCSAVIRCPNRAPSHSLNIQVVLDLIQGVTMQETELVPSITPVHGLRAVPGQITPGQAPFVSVRWASPASPPFAWAAKGFRLRPSSDPPRSFSSFLPETSSLVLTDLQQLINTHTTVWAPIIFFIALHGIPSGKWAPEDGTP
eukprot:3941537-Rhodomonas_salina.13